MAEDVDMLRQEFRHEVVHQRGPRLSSFFRFIQGFYRKRRHHKSKYRSNWIIFIGPFIVIPDEPDYDNDEKREQQCI